MSGEVRLLDCPFCGNSDVGRDEGCFPVGSKGYWEVRCGNPSCYAHEPSDSTRVEAIERWNRRAHDYADLLARYEAVVGGWREALRHRVFCEGLSKGYKVGQADAVANAAIEQIEAGIRAMQDNGGG